MQTRACPLCGGREATLLFGGGDRLHNLPGTFELVRCANCGLDFLAEIPQNLADYYPPSYDAHRPTGQVARGWRGMGLRKKAALVQSLFPRGARLLDVGCAAGDFLGLFCDDARWQLAGLESNPQAAERAAQRFGLDVTVASLPASGLRSQSFDVITLWHVIEHVADPVAALREMARLLRPGGVLVLAFPAGDSWPAACFRSAWAGYDLPRHLVTFTRPTFARALALAELQGRRVRGVVLGLEMLRQSLAFRFPGWPAALQRLGAVAALPFFWLIEWITGREPIVTIIATRNDHA